MIKKVLFIFFLGLLPWHNSLGDDSAVFRSISKFNGQTFEVDISDDDLKTSPKWLDEKVEPPLSISKAKTLAQDAFRRRFPSYKLYVIDSISCIYIPFCRDWLYQVKYSQFYTDTNDYVNGSTNHISAVVLFSGKVILPEFK